MKGKEIEITEIFADPTLDISFKMLFGRNKDKEILISLVNSLLGFKGKDTIIEWNPSDQALYWKQKQNESDFIKQKEYDKEEAFEKGKWKGEVKGEIGKIKMGIEAKLEDEKILKKLNYTKDKFIDFKNYFQEHPDHLEIDDNESVIMTGMDIEYPDQI